VILLHPKPAAIHAAGLLNTWPHMHVGLIREAGARVGCCCCLSCLSSPLSAIACQVIVCVARVPDTSTAGRGLPRLTIALLYMCSHAISAAWVRRMHLLWRALQN
jgi:hypothetical protein